MNPIYAALLGGVGGAVVTWSGQIVLEILKQRQEFQKTRLVALQNCVFLIDLIIAHGENPEKSYDDKLWRHAKDHTSSSAIFFPAHMQGAFTHLARVVICELYPGHAYSAISRPALDELRDECLRMIKSYHGFNWRSIRKGLGMDA